MTAIISRGKTINTIGELPAIGSEAPDFKLVKTDFSEVNLADLRGKKVILNIFLSVETSVCALSVRRFNAEAAGLANTVVLCVSKDLPYTHARFCGAEGITGVVSVSGFRSDDFGRAYGVQIIDGPAWGLYSRAIVIIDEQGTVIYTQQVPEIGQEPDYAAALAAVQ